MPKLAEAGLFGLGVPALLGGTGGHVTDAVAAIAAVSERSLAAGFVFWGHRTFIEYLLQSPNDALRETAAAGSAGGRRGRRDRPFERDEVPLRHRGTADQGQRSDRRRDAHRRQACRGSPICARRDSMSPQPSRATATIPAFVASLSSDDAGLERSADLDLMAMRATNTAALKIDNVRIGADRILHPNASEWLPKVRPAFLGLQCAHVDRPCAPLACRDNSRLKQ